MAERLAARGDLRLVVLRDGIADAAQQEADRRLRHDARAEEAVHRRHAPPRVLLEPPLRRVDGRDARDGGAAARDRRKCEIRLAQLARDDLRRVDGLAAADREHHIGLHDRLIAAELRDVLIGSLAARVQKARELEPHALRCRDDLLLRRLDTAAAADDDDRLAVARTDLAYLLISLDAYRIIRKRHRIAIPQGCSLLSCILAAPRTYSAPST